MLKELSTMALVVTMTTTISNHFDTVMMAAKDISSVYAAAGNSGGNPEVFLNSVKAQEKRLNALGDKVASIDIQKEMGPFGVMVPKTK